LLVSVVEVGPVRRSRQPVRVEGLPRQNRQPTLPVAPGIVASFRIREEMRGSRGEDSSPKNHQLDFLSSTCLLLFLSVSEYRSSVSS